MLPNHDYVQGTAPFLLDTRSITPIQSLRAAEAFLTNGSIEDDVNNRVHEKFVWILSHSHIKHQCHSQQSFGSIYWITVWVLVGPWAHQKIVLINPKKATLFDEYAM